LREDSLRLGPKKLILQIRAVISKGFRRVRDGRERAKTRHPRASARQAAPGGRDIVCQSGPLVGS